jgi:hypothetical protein
MGLDTGIVVIITDEQKFGFIPEEFLCMRNRRDRKEYEIHYWRKNYRIDNILANVFSQCSGGRYYDLSLDLEILEKAYSEILENWETIKKNDDYIFEVELERGMKFARFLLNKPKDSYIIEFYSFC